MDDEVIRNMEIDLEIAHVGEILEAHGVAPTSELVTAIWDWAEQLRQAVAHDLGGELL
mgnify:CR=1 FL=1